MIKKLITACIGLVVLAAFALPATAVAANKPVLTDPTGTAMSSKTTTCTSLGETGCLVGTNIGSTKLKSDDSKTVLADCSTAKLTGTLTTNSNGTVEGDIQTATFSGS